jgi:hypothetical protein
VELGNFLFLTKKKGAGWGGGGGQKSLLKIHVQKKQNNRRGKEGNRFEWGPKGGIPGCGPKKSMNKINDKEFQSLACFFSPIIFSFCRLEKTNSAQFPTSLIMVPLPFWFNYLNKTK